MLRNILGCILFTCISACSAPERTQREQEAAASALSRVVAADNHPERMKAAAELSRLYPQADGEQAQLLVEALVKELVRHGSATDLTQTFRTKASYPVVQIASQIDDAELLAALLKYFELPQNDPAWIVAAEIASEARLWEAHVVKDGLDRDLLPRPPDEKPTYLLYRTTVGGRALTAWRRFADISASRYPHVVVAVRHLEYLSGRVALLKDEAAATEARKLLRELAGDTSWLVRAIVVSAMREDALYDPEAVRLLEERVEPFQADLLRGLKASREARGLPLDKTTPINESRTLN